MGQLGIGGSEHSASKFFGRTICGAEIIDNRLRLTLDGSQQIEIWDDRQSCCENRYMRTDDDLSTLNGHKIVRIDAKSGPDIDDGSESHEVCFVEVGTDKGFITISNHNEHNGYYGGFDLTITEVKSAPP